MSFAGVFISKNDNRIRKVKSCKSTFNPGLNTFCSFRISEENVFSKTHRFETIFFEFQINPGLNSLIYAQKYSKEKIIIVRNLFQYVYTMFWLEYPIIAPGKIGSILPIQNAIHKI